MNTYILGPCSLESKEIVKKVIDELYPIMNGKNWYFKGSFDKANRTSIYSNRGPGLDEGKEIFAWIKNSYPGIKTVTDIHEPWHAKELRDLIDMVQIPAFLCRQTDLITEAAKWFNEINVKKGQWLAPQSMEHVVTKIKEVNPNCKVYITERGTSLGYSGLIPDFRAVDILKSFSDGVILDCTHSTQKPKGDTTGGDRELAKKYALAAKIFEYDGVFIETHPDPKNAISDADSQVELEWIREHIYNI
jgi:2-dehydro-3-deoxyphosphooctonate aldolase (KDO 8-P synthase)